MSDCPLIDFAESRARVTDPETSHDGAKAIAPHIGILHRQFFDKLKELGQATANEVAMAISDNHARINSLRRRASDLEKAGWIRAIGKRLCQRTGTMATVYECVGEFSKEGME